MKGENKKRWMKLCEQAADEQDGGKVQEMAQEITRLLQEKTRIKALDAVL